MLWVHRISMRPNCAGEWRLIQSPWQKRQPLPPIAFLLRLKAHRHIRHQREAHRSEVHAATFRRSIALAHLFKLASLEVLRKGWLNDRQSLEILGRPLIGVISVFRESSTKLPRPSLTSSSAGVCGIPKVFECGASLDRLDEPSRPPPLAGPGVAGSVAVRY